MKKQILLGLAGVAAAVSLTLLLPGGQAQAFEARKIERPSYVFLLDRKEPAPAHPDTPADPGTPGDTGTPGDPGTPDPTPGDGVQNPGSGSGGSGYYPITRPTRRERPSLSSIVARYRERQASRIQAPAAEPAPQPEPQPEPGTPPAPTPNPGPAPATPPAGDPRPTPDPSGFTADELRLIQMINDARAAAGVEPLTPNLALTRAARAKSRDMLETRTVSHTSPNFGSTQVLMQREGVTGYRTGGENVGYARSVMSAHSGFMSSDGHRRNLLNERYTDIGVGLATDPYGGVYVTELFIGR